MTRAIAASSSPKQEVTMDKLLPCPFTGREPTEPIWQPNGDWRIWAGDYHLSRPSRALVVAAWNTRTPADKLTEAREMPRDDLAEVLELTQVHFSSEENADALRAELAKRGYGIARLSAEGVEG
jgi:hypothetical protein